MSDPEGNYLSPSNHSVSAVSLWQLVSDRKWSQRRARADITQCWIKTTDWEKLCQWQPVFYWVFDEYVCSHKALSVQQTKHYCHTWWWAHSMPQFCLNRNIGTTCPLHEHMSWCHALILTMSWKTQTKWNALTQYEHFYITWNGRNSSHALLDKENDTGGNNVINNATTIRTTTSTEQ